MTEDTADRGDRRERKRGIAPTVGFTLGARMFEARFEASQSWQTSSECLTQVLHVATITKRVTNSEKQIGRTSMQLRNL